ncbi:hypothetical protein J6Z39_00600 [bacterium]|nr:hypothetical protein [bacterium]
MTYTAYVMYKQDRELTTITRSDYTSKKAFAEDLRRNGYAVKLISTPEKFNHDLEVYCEKKERRNEIDRFVRAELKKSRERIKAATEELTKANNEEATQEDETKKEDKPMKKRFFYLADIDTTFTVTPMTKKEIISIGQELKELCEFMSHDQTISGYTKAGEFFYYDCSNFDSFKKSDIINAVSVIYSDESGDYYWGGFDINEWGVANPTEDGAIIIADHDNIKEVDHEDYREDQTAAEPKKQYDVFYTNQSIPSLAIYNHKPDRWKYDIPPVLAMETEKSLYFCPAYYNVDDVVKFLKRNAARSENK